MFFFKKIYGALKKALSRYGIFGTVKRLPYYVLIDLGLRSWWVRTFWSRHTIYSPPSSQQLDTIEKELRSMGCDIEQLFLDSDDFKAFQKMLPFPATYHGGIDSGVWSEKMCEHFLAYKLLDLVNYGPEDIYVDVAACNSPWAALLREKFDTKSFAIDLEPSKEYSDLDYYLTGDATSTSFSDESVKGVSLQCAYEMFMDDHDLALIDELARILTHDGTAVICPLYMHTHYCAYASPEYYNKGHVPEGSKEYVRPDIVGIKSSRKYDPRFLNKRILDRIKKCNMAYKILVLRDAKETSAEIYCHFVLVITKS